jgi:hypothetical protein
LKAGLWSSLEILSTQAALLMEWRQALGDEFTAARAFLRPTQQQSESYPCVHPISCGCRHRVVFETPDEVSAICDCEEAGCDPILLDAADLIVHALNGKRIAASIRQAFQFDESENGDIGESHSCLVGTWGVRRSRVFFNVPISENGLLNEIDRLCVASPEPFVLLTPTSRFCTPMVQRALRRQGNAQVALSGVVALTPDGRLELIPAAKPLIETFLGDFGKRITEGTPLERAIHRVEEKLNAIAKNRAPSESAAISEDVARQAFEIVKKLDTGRPMKKPSLLTVFRLYCINERSAAQIADQCGCSKGTVIDRLNVLANRVGMPLAQLRTYSPQFERTEKEIDDWRARRIDRQDLAHGSEDDDETEA